VQKVRGATNHSPILSKELRYPRISIRLYVFFGELFNLMYLYCIMERSEIINNVFAKETKAIVTGIDIPEKLQKFNASNNTLRVRVNFTYVSELQSDDVNDVTNVLRNVTGNNSSSVIANLDGYVVPDNPSATAQQKVDAFVAQIKGKTLYACILSCPISALVADMDGLQTVTQVHDKATKHTYASLYDVVLDKATDDLKVLTYQRLVTRLATRLADKRLYVGAFVPDVTAGSTTIPAGVTTSPAI